MLNVTHSSDTVSYTRLNIEGYGNINLFNAIYNCQINIAGGIEEILLDYATGNEEVGSFLTAFFNKVYQTNGKPCILIEVNEEVRDYIVNYINDLKKPESILLNQEFVSSNGNNRVVMILNIYKLLEK